MVAERFATARTLQQALIVSSSIARTFDIEAAKSAAKHFADVLTPAINLGLSSSPLTPPCWWRRPPTEPR